MAQTNCYGGVDKSFSGASPVINRMTTHHGRIEMISFLMVLIRVTNKDFSITSPTTSPFLVPILNKRMYVSIKPAIIFSDPAEPK
jgi:hypothetical protein